MRFITATAAVLVGYWFLLRPMMRRISDNQVAQYIEERYPDLQDRLISAVELGSSDPRAGGMLDLLIRDALNKTNRVDFSVFVDRRRITTYGFAGLGSVAALMLLLGWGPSFFPYGFDRLYMPWLEASAQTRSLIQVTPGDIDLAKGADQQIKAQLVGFDSPDVRLFVQPEGAPAGSSYVMEPQLRGSGFMYLLVDLQRSARYYVEASGVRSPEYRRPVLIVGMPRSGTTLLFRVLRESPALGALPREGHDVWRRFHHPRRRGWRSDHVGAGEVKRVEPRWVRAFFYSHIGATRLLEKTADNVVRVPYLLDLFPDAYFIVVTREPCDVVNSYINMWRHPLGRFRSYFVPAELRIPGYAQRRRWCSTLIDGWRDLTSTPVPEIAFRQWRTYVDCIVAARRIVPARQWIELRFEEVLSRPQEVLDDLCRRIDLDVTPRMREALEAFVAQPVNAMSPEGQGRWRTQNRAEVEALLPRMVEPAAAIGYLVDPATGDVRPAPRAASRTNASTDSTT